jgi:hypothetical protein
MAEFITSEHQLFFQTAEPVSPSILAESLLGLDAIVRESAKVLTRLIPEGPKVTADVLIQSIESGSYKENFFVRLAFGKGRQLEKNLEAFRNTLGLKKMETKKIVGWAIAAAVLYAGYQYFSPSDPNRVVIQNSFNIIGKDVEMTGEEVIALLEASLGNKKEELKREVVKLAKPVNQTLPGRLALDNDPSFEVPAQVIAKIPKVYEKSEPSESMRDLTNEQIVIRALDLDNPTKGWWVSIPQLSSKRLPLEVGDGIKVGLLPAGKYVYGDLTVLFKEDKHGSNEPARVFLRKVRMNEADPAGTSL